MGKTMACPFCNNKDTLKVVYCYRGYKKRNKDDVRDLLKTGTKYRNEKPRYEKYDFDGEKITATLYNKYCPSCHRYFHSIGKMAVIDIDTVIIVYSVEKQIYRYDYNFSNNTKAHYSCKHNYICIAEKVDLSDSERFNILKSIKLSKMNFWKKEYNYREKFNYNWIIKVEYHNGLSECYCGYDKVPDNWETFIDGFKSSIHKYDKEKLIDKLV